MEDRGKTHMIVMAALGRCFQLGDLYDYRTDRILSDENPFKGTNSHWASAKQVDDNTEVELICPDAHHSINKWENMGLDVHTRASAIAGLVGEYHGASLYLNDRNRPREITKTLICRIKTKSEYMNFTSLNERNPPEAQPNQEDPIIQSRSEATHAVLGVTYGVDAYCLLTQELDDEEVDDDELQTIAKDYLSKTASMMKKALKERQDLNEFKSLLMESERKTRLKCRLYTDLKNQSFRECDIFEAYNFCLKLITLFGRNSLNDDSVESDAVVTSVLLCPLNSISWMPISTSRITGKSSLNYHDVDVELIDRCCRLLDDLERVSAIAEATRNSFKKTNRTPVRKFINAVGVYQELLRVSLRKDIVKARESQPPLQNDEVEKTLVIAESHSLFRPSRLMRWLYYKSSELHVIKVMTGVKGVVFLSNKSQMEKELAHSFDKNYFLVLWVPSLDERTNAILEKMFSYLSTCTKLLQPSGDGEDPEADDTSDDDMDEVLDGYDGSVKRPWHVIESKRNRVLDKIRELANHSEQNRHVENDIQFFIIPEDGRKQFGCRYSIYEGNTLVQDGLSRLPSRPTDLKIFKEDVGLNTSKNNKMASTYHLEWECADFGYPCHFLVEYRTKDGGESKAWKQRKTSASGEKRITLHLKLDSFIIVEFRVAADSCIGRSEFSEVASSESAAPLPGQEKVLEEVNIDEIDDQLLMPDSVSRKTSTPNFKECRNNSESDETYYDSVVETVRLTGDFNWQSGSTTTSRSRWTKETATSELFQDVARQMISEAADEESRNLIGSAICVNDNQLDVEHNRTLWKWIVKETRKLLEHPKTYRIPPLQKAFSQFNDLIDRLGIDIEKSYNEISELESISDLLADIAEWLIHRRRELRKIFDLLKDTRLPVFELDEIKNRKRGTNEKHAKVFILKVDYVQCPLVERIQSRLDKHRDDCLFNLPILQFTLFQEERLQFINKTLRTFAAIQSLASRTGSHLCRQDTTYQIGLAPLCSSFNDGTIMTIDYDDINTEDCPVVVDVSSPVKEKSDFTAEFYMLTPPEDRRKDGVEIRQSDASSSSTDGDCGNVARSVGTSLDSGRELSLTTSASISSAAPKRRSLEQSLKEIKPELEDCFVHIENVEMFWRTVAKYADKMDTFKNCYMEKREVRDASVACADDHVAFNCRRCQKTCEKPVRIAHINLDKFKHRKRLCKQCKCPVSEHVFQQFEWLKKVVKVKTKLTDMKKELQSNGNSDWNVEQLLEHCSIELKTTKAKVLKLLKNACDASAESDQQQLPDWQSKAAYLILLLKGRTIREHSPDYLMRLVTLTNLQLLLTGASATTTSTYSAGCRDGSSQRLDPSARLRSAIEERLPGDASKFKLRSD